MAESGGLLNHCTIFCIESSNLSSVDVGDGAVEAQWSHNPKVIGSNPIPHIL